MTAIGNVNAKTMITGLYKAAFLPDYVVEEW